MGTVIVIDPGHGGENEGTIESSELGETGNPPDLLRDTGSSGHDAEGNEGADGD